MAGVIRPVGLAGRIAAIVIRPVGLETSKPFYGRQAV